MSSLKHFAEAKADPKFWQGFVDVMQIIHTDLLQSLHWIILQIPWMGILRYFANVKT